MNVHICPQKQWLLRLLCFLCCPGDCKSRCTCGRKRRWQCPSLHPHAFKVSHSPTKIPAWLRILKGSQLQFNRGGVVLWAHHVVGHKPSLHSGYNKDSWITAQMPPQYTQLIKKKKKDMHRPNVSINCPGPRSSLKHLTLSFLKIIYTQG